MLISLSLSFRYFCLISRSHDQAVNRSDHSTDSTTDLDRSKPYVPVLERSSQLMEDSELDSTRIVIDANPMPLRKKAKRKRKQEQKPIKDEVCLLVCGMVESRNHSHKTGGSSFVNKCDKGKI